MEMAEKVVTSSLALLVESKLSTRHEDSVTKFQQCPLLNVSYCPPSEAALSNGKSLVIVVYNPLGWKREEAIRIPVSTEVIVLDSAGREIESQLLPLSNASLRIRNFHVKAYLDRSPGDTLKYWLAFSVSVPPLGFSTYVVSSAKRTEVGSSTISEVYTSEGSTDFTVEVGQGNLKLLYNANEGKLTHYINGRSLVFGPSDAVQFVHKLLKPQMCPQLGEIPRSTFQFDFELERKILAEAEKESQNWSRLGIENHPSKPAESTSSSLIMDFLAVGEELMPHRDFSNIGSCSQGKPAAANANDCQAPLQHLATVKNLSVVVGDSSGIGDASCEGFCDSTQYRP